MILTSLPSRGLSKPAGFSVENPASLVNCDAINQGEAGWEWFWPLLGRKSGGGAGSFRLRRKVSREVGFGLRQGWAAGLREVFTFLK